MNISSISNAISSLSNTALNNDKSKESNLSFEQLLNDSIKEVNKQQVEGYNAMEGIATGKVENLQEAVRQMEEAELSMKLALETKNKAISAYKEIMRMQV